MDTGHCLFFDTLDELESFSGVEHKQDGSAKHRLIWDFLRPEVNSTVALSERIVLRRLEDVVEDGKHLFRVHVALEWLVVDVAHAFHNIPIRPSEQQLMCGKVSSWLALR